MNKVQLVDGGERRSRQGKPKCSSNHGTDICCLDRLLRLFVDTIISVLVGVGPLVFGVHRFREVGVVEQLRVERE